MTEDYKKMRLCPICKGKVNREALNRYYIFVACHNCGVIVGGYDTPAHGKMLKELGITL